MTICEIAKAITVASWLYLAWAVFLVIGTLFMPKGLPVQIAANRAELRDAWRRVQARSWQSPIYALFLPLVFTFILPITYPLATFASVVALLLFGAITSC